MQTLCYISEKPRDGKKKSLSRWVLQDATKLNCCCCSWYVHHQWGQRQLNMRNTAVGWMLMPLFQAFTDNKAEPVQLRVLPHWWHSQAGGTVDGKKPSFGKSISFPSVIWSIWFASVLRKGSEALWNSDVSSHLCKKDDSDRTELNAL